VLLALSAFPERDSDFSPTATSEMTITLVRCAILIYFLVIIFFLRRLERRNHE
jgi:hypothetical protein